MKERERIIGGMFGLAEARTGQSSIPPFMKGRVLLLINARCGIYVLMKALEVRRVWLPSFLCESVINAAGSRKCEVKFYEVAEDLAGSSDTWLNEVKKGDLVLLIDYFGFPIQVKHAEGAKAEGAWVLEDACQALLSERIDTSVDFVLYSPRKFLGVPDGGVLVCNNSAPEFDAAEIRHASEEWWLKALRASLMRRDFDYSGRDAGWFDLFREVEAEQPIGAFAMSELSWRLLICSFDYDAIALRRRENYQVLGKVLREWAIYPDLLPGVVPVGFPICISQRDKMRERLFRQRIYPPVHWPVPDVVPTEYQASRKLAANIMTLPCDQRYFAHDMERMAGVILEGLRS